METIKHTGITPDECMVSFNMVMPFKRIQLELACETMIFMSIYHVQQLLKCPNNLRLWIVITASLVDTYGASTNRYINVA